MARFLFLDDDEKRHGQFKKMTIGCIVTHVETVEECEKALLSEPPFGCVFLDHDLGGLVFVEEKEGTGTEVAEFIANDLPKEKLPKKIVIHSWNPEGAKRMESILRAVPGLDVKRIPFSFITGDR